MSLRGLGSAFLLHNVLLTIILTCVRLSVNEQLMRNLADHHRATLHLAQASVSAASSQTASEPPSPAGNKKNKGSKMQSF